MDETYVHEHECVCVCACVLIEVYKSLTYCLPCRLLSIITLLTAEPKQKKDTKTPPPTKQFGHLLHVKEKKKKLGSPDTVISKKQKKYQKFQEQQLLEQQLQQQYQHDQQQQDTDLIIKEVDALGHTLEKTDAEEEGGRNFTNYPRKQKNQKVSCSECHKKVIKMDVKKLPCVLKNLHHGKKITAGKCWYT